jgi:hypothetical protein
MLIRVSQDLIVQGRGVSARDIRAIEQLIVSHPDWSRWRLSRALCAQWDWRNQIGQFKDMAARSLLLKLEERGLVALPARRRVAANRMKGGWIARLSWDQRPLECAWNKLGRLCVEEVSGEKTERQQVAAALAQFHYLGYGGAVGENMQYAVRDGQGRLLACVVFGAAAWKCQARDRWIGWDPVQRQRGLPKIANNSRFLILPWVKVPGLAGWTLSRVLRRLSGDWQNKYGHGLVLAETFVERERFSGVCYRAANWIRIGSTCGRSRQDRDHKIQVPIKDVYLYALEKDFSKELCR